MVGALLLGLLDATFDVADGFEILAELGAVALADLGFQAIDAAGNVIEDAALLLEHGQAGGRVGAVAIAEEAFEDGARIDFHGQRRGGAAPGDGVGVGAAIAGIAAAGQRRTFEAEFERGELRGLAEFARGDLVGGDARVDADAFGLLGVDAGQPGGAFAGVVAGAIAQRAAVDLREAGEAR